MSNPFQDDLEQILSEPETESNTKTSDQQNAGDVGSSNPFQEDLDQVMGEPSDDSGGGIPEFEQDPNFLSGEAGEGYSLPTRLAGEAIQEGNQNLPDSLQNVASSFTEGASSMFRGFGRFVEHVGKRSGIDTVEETGESLKEQTEASQELLDPERAKGFDVTDPHFYTGTIPQVFGSVTPFMATGIGTSALYGSGLTANLAGAATSGLLESGVNTGMILEQADQRGLSQDQKDAIASSAFAKNALLNTALSFGEIGLARGNVPALQKLESNVLGDFMNGKFGSAAFRTAGESAQEFLQEGTQGTIQASELAGQQQSWGDFFVEGGLGAIGAAPVGFVSGLSESQSAQQTETDPLVQEMEQDNIDKWERRTEELKRDIQQVQEEAQQNDQTTFTFNDVPLSIENSVENNARIVAQKDLLQNDSTFADDFSSALENIQTQAKVETAKRAQRALEDLDRKTQLGLAKIEQDLPSDPEAQADLLVKNKTAREIQERRSFYETINRALDESGEDPDPSIEENLQVYELAADRAGARPTSDSGIPPEPSEPPESPVEETMGPEGDPLGPREENESVRTDEIAEQSREPVTIEGELTPDNITQQLADVENVPHTSQVIETLNNLDIDQETRSQVLEDVFQQRESIQEVTPGYMDEFDMLNKRHMLDFFDGDDVYKTAESGEEAIEGGLQTVSAVFDLDNFGAFNEEVGHAGGDRVINIFGEIAKKNGLYLHHFGGDEYAAPATVPLDQFEQKIRRTKEEFKQRVEDEFSEYDLTTDVTAAVGENVAVADFELMSMKEQGNRGELGISETLDGMDLSDYTFSKVSERGRNDAKQLAGIQQSNRIQSDTRRTDRQPNPEVQPTSEGGTADTRVEEPSESPPADPTSTETVDPLQKKVRQLEETTENGEPLEEPYTGKSGRARTDNYDPTIHYSIVPAGELITSFDEEFPNNALQGRTTARQQFRSEIRSDFDPSRLGLSEQAEDGAPVVAQSDSFVESGNLRVDLLRNLYQEDAPQSEQYQNYLIENAQDFGMDPQTITDVEDPVLVRVREPDTLRPRERIGYAREANEQTDVAERSVVDRARRDADRIDSSMLQGFDTDYAIDAQQNNNFVRSFIQSLPANQQDAMLDSNQNLTTNGRKRILFALNAKAFDDLDTLQSFIQREGQGQKRIFEPLAEKAADFAKIQDRILNGEINQRLDITGSLTTAINRLGGMKDSDAYRNFEPQDPDRSKVEQFLESPERMFSGDDFTEDMMKLLERFGGASGSKKKMRYFLDQYIQQTLETAQTTERALPGTGGATVRVPFSPSEILRKAARETEVEHGMDHVSLPMFKKAIRREMRRWAIDNYEPTDEGAQNFVGTIKEALEVEETGENGIERDGNSQAREVQIKQITNGLSSQHLREFYRIEQKDAQEPLTKWFAQQVTDFDVMPDENIDDNIKVVVNKVLQGESEAEFTEEGTKRYKFLMENSPLITTNWHKDMLGELIPALEAEGITDTPSILQAAKFMMMQGGSQRASEDSRNMNRFIDDRIDFGPMLQRLEEKEANNPELEGITDTARDALENWERLYGQKIKKRMRSGMSIQEIFRETQNVDMTLDDFMTLAEGSVLNAEEMVLLGSYMLELENQVQELAEQAHRGGAAESTFQELQELREKRNAIRQAWSATKSEWGRAGRAQQVVLNEQVAQQKRIKDKIVAGMTPQELTESEQEAMHERAKENILDKIEEGEFGEVDQELWEDFAELIDERKLTNRDAMKDFYNKHGKFNWKDFGTWLWHANIFSSLATNERNLLGNMFNVMIRVPTDFARVGIDAAESAITGKERERFLDSVGREVRAIFSSWGRATQKAMNAFWWGRSVDDGANFDYLTKEPPLPETFKRVYGWDLRFMHALDGFFRTINAEMTKNRMASDLSRKPPEDLEELARQSSSEDVYTELIKNPTDEMIDSAAGAAQEGVFQAQLNNQWNPFRALENLSKSLEKSTIGYPFSFMLRFMRTTSNLFSKGFKFLGGGYLTGAYNEYQAMKEADLDEKTDYRELSRQDLSLAMVGSAAHLLMAPLALAGNMTGGGPEDDDLYKEWLNQGWQPYSLMVDVGGERYTISYRYWAPFNMQMALLSDMAEQFRYNDELPASEKIQRSAANLGTFFSEQSLLYGITNFVDWVRGRPTDRNPFVSVMSGFAVPWVSLLQDYRNLIDPKLRNPETWFEEFANQIPGLSQKIEPIRNKYGQAVQRESPLGPVQPFTIPLIGNVDQNFETYQENSLLENRIQENMQRLEDGFGLQGVENQRVKNWIKAEHIVRKLNRTDSKDEASKLLMEFKDRGLLDDQVNEWLTWVIRAEESEATKAQYGDYLYDDDRELIWYSGDYLASKIERRLAHSDRSDEWKQRKWRALKEFLKVHKYNDLSSEQQKRKINQLYNQVFQLASERGNPLFKRGSASTDRGDGPLNPAP